MRKARLIILLLSLLVTIVSCKRSQMPAIQRALSVYASEPDSALAILNGMERKSLPASEEAMYALIYTASQDKSGLDVSSDSLIRIAYDHYAQLPKDSLYSRCMYYMGKYYWLNDSLDRAEYCLKQAERRAAIDCDTATQCLALEKLSKVMRHGNTRKSIYYIDKALNIYCNYSKAQISNTIYMILGKSESEWQLDRNKEALELSKRALDIALKLNNPIALSDVYQDMACFATDLGHYGKALEYAKSSYKLSNSTDIRKIVALAYGYEAADSLKQCQNLIEKFAHRKDFPSYSSANLRFLIAIKKHDYKNAKLYHDTVSICIENMYKKELHRSMDNYDKLMSEKIGKIKNESKAVMFKYIAIMTILLAISIIIIILQSYKNYKIAAMKELTFEKERTRNEQILHKKEVEQVKSLHEEEILHKEEQIDTMRNIIARKVDVVNKLNVQSNTHIVITDYEWNEIEEYLEGADNLFVSRLRERYPNLLVADIRLLMLLRLKISTKVLANIYGVSEKTIRQKLFLFKEKINLTERGVSLRQFINHLPVGGINLS